ncbi:MAG TPA: SDR family NAD(P)-dependent oxidoreductase, partial [Polyangia bacterium]
MSHADQLRCTTLAELLEAAAAVGPPDALRFRAPPGEGGAVAETTTASYAALADDARRVLGGLRASGARRGDPVLLIHESAARFYAAFWGCQLGGLVAVPVGVTPGADRADEARRLITVWRTMGRPLIVTERAYVSMVAALVTSVDPGARVLAHEDLAAAPAATTLDPGAPDDLALVQFSSGSTSAPKGVRLTHANLVANSRQMAGRAPLGRDMVEVGWMPHYHDMGLIGCHLAPMLVAGRQVKMGPLHFLRRPLDWLDLATHYRATLLTGTNTSLRLVLRRLARTAPGAWDLASVESLYVGAAPIAPATVRACVETFAPFGLRRTAVRAAYGLAEASVGVAMGLPEAPRWHRVLREPLARREVIPAGDADPRAVVELLAIGPPLEGEEVRIVGDDDAPVPAGAVGHVQTRGPNVTSGYYEDPAATAAARCDGFWRTGDLGFMADGRLVICGRTKELLFAGGRNLYAQDVEAVACETKGLRAAVACAAPGAGADGAEERTLLFLVPDGEDWRAGVEVLRAARRHVQQALRLTVDQVVPIAYREIPRTSSGKVRRFRLAQRFAAGEFDAVVAELATRVGPETPPPAPARPAGPMLPLVVAAWAGALRCDPRAVGPDVPFSELSGSSVVAQDILARLEQATGRWLGYDVLLECETPAQMAAWLEAGRTGRARVTLGEPAPAAQGGAVAIVGLGCRFPGAAGPDDFWRALVAGVDAVRPFPAGRFGAPAAAGLRCRTGSFLDDPYAFDPAFFGIGADEAAVMDPQQRLMLEVACECLQRGGYGGARREGLRVGVFVGASQLGYQERLVAGRERAAALQAVAASAAFGALDAAAQAELRRVFAHLAPERATHPNTMVGNLLNMLAARVAHELDLRGPALAVDTACSSALVALHLACDSLRRGECELAVAGGVSLNLTPSGYRLFEAAGALSPTGRSRPFAADADGFVPGEGAGAVLLKPLAAARADGDPIVAVIRGSAMNNDGRSLGAMAPNPDGQLEVLRAAYAAAGVDPASVSAVECHGTGTRIGDPVELRSVAELFGATGGPLWVGSVKSNLGHLLGAAGVAGLLKTVLALAHRTLPPTLHATPPSPLLERAARLRLVTETTAWAGPAPRRAGVSSFGFGGTNCHVVLEEAPPVAAPVADAAGPRLLALSAPSAAHLAADAARLGASGALDGPGAAGRDAELLAARPQLPVRAARVLAAGEPAGPALAALAAGGPAPGWLRAAGPRRRAPQVAWLFPGQGAQHPRQALGLYRGWPAFRERLEALCGLVTLERPLIDFCYGVDVDAEALRRTDVAQPLLVAFQIALAQCLLDLGLRPAAVLGHSVGELAAAAIAGALEPADAVRLAALRGRLMEEHGGAGAMLAVYASAADIDAALGPAAIAFGPDLGVAAINGPRQTVLAGARPALAAAQAALERARIGAQAVPVRHAFHSPLMAEAAARFARAAIALAPRPFTVPLVSTVRGAPLEGRDFTLAYLAEQIREPVRFAAAFDALAALRIDAFLDLGPGATLAGLARHALPAGDARPALACCRAPDAPDEDADRAQALRALGELWVQGAPLRALPAAGPAPRPRPTVPPLAFVEGHYAIEDGAAADAVAAGPDAPAATAVLHVRRFRPAPAPPPRPLAGTWLILGDDAARLEAVRAALVAAGAGAISAPSGEAFVREADDRVRLDPTRRDHVRWLLDMAAGRAPAGLVLLTALDEPRAAADPGGARSFAILAALAHAVRAARAPWPLTVVTRGGLAVGAGEAPEPLQAAIGAMAQALACELPESRGRVVDLAADDPAAVAAAVVAELAAPGPELLIARRGGGRFAPRLTAVAAPAQPLPAGGAYLVLGGAGGVGAALCRWLAAPAGAQARVVVTAGRGGAGALGAELAGRGVQTEHVTLDVRDAAALRRAVAELGARHGRLHAVVHCAGVLEVGALEHRDPGRLRLVLDTKMRGAAGLAAAVAGQPVDRVVLISSVAGAVPVLGRGLCDYAAANAFLDALATRESTAATRWSAVAYSRWRGIGMAAGLDDRTADAGPLRHPLAAEAAARAFGAALGCVEPHVIVADPADVAGWDEAAAGAELNRQDAKAPVVQRQSGGPAVLNGSAHLIEVAAPDPAPTAADESLEQFLRRRLAQATGGAAADLDPDAPFQRLGLTSLAAVDLLKELEARIGRPLGVTLLFEHNTLAKVLAFLDAEAPAAAPSAPAATPVREEAIPLLPAQQTFYANQAFFPHLPCYVFLRLDLAGEVAPAALDEALALLGERHPMLGVGFEWLDGKLVQRRRGGAHRALVRDLTAAAPREREALLLRWEEQLRNEVYDLARGPLLRVGLARTAPGQHSLLFNVHHIVADAWSTQLLVTELLELHGALRDRRPPGLAPLRSGFADCARAIEDLARAGGAESLAYWERALAGAPPGLALPFDGDPRAEVRGTCQLLQRVLDEPTTRGLERTARAWDVSFFHVLLASYLVALRRWSGQDDLVVRVANARREARVPDIERVVGCFADSLPVRVRVDGGAGARALCATVREAVVAAQRYPLASSVQLAGVAGARDHLGPRGVTPAGISFPNFPAPERFGGLTVTGMRAGSASGFTQLGLIAWSFGSRLHVSWNTIDGLFRPATVARLSGEHEEVLRALAAGADAPDRRVADRGHRGPAPAPAAPARPAGAPPRPRPGALLPGAVVHERIFARAAACPAAAAVIAPTGTVRYAELAQRAANLGAELGAAGARPGVRVGLLCRPSPELAIGALGILGTGAAYVPIDPEYPDGRVQAIARHAGFALLVTTADQLPRLGALAGGALGTVVLLDEPGALARPLVPAGLALLTPRDLPADAAPPPPGRVGPDDLAYILYTSGTTGTPKGVMVQHRSLTLFLDWVHETFAVTPDDRFIQTAPLSFGAGLRQVYSPLLAGAALVPT